MTSQESLNWLYSLQVHGIKLGLENIARLCSELGIETESSEQRKFIHVAGTNGKGSVCAMLAAICTAAGKRTALYTSPHLVSFRERIRLGDHLIPEEAIAEGLSEIRKLTSQWDHAPTFFEVATALALAWFQKQRAEWIILETGMGGRLDATNIITPVVSVLTPISLDHTQYLGSTLTEIAREKAGIIKRGISTISAPQSDEVAKVLALTSERLNSKINTITHPIPKSWRVSLAGSHQRMNAAVAFAAIVRAGLRPDPQTVAKAIGSVKWPGRFQREKDARIILDGAHNSAGAQCLADTWQEEFPGEKATLIFGMLEDKDVQETCAALLPIAARILCVPVNNPRALPPTDLLNRIRHFSEIPCKAARDLPSALAEAEAENHRILVAGSLFLIGEAMTHLGVAAGTHELSSQ